MNVITIVGKLFKNVSVLNENEFGVSYKYVISQSQVNRNKGKNELKYINNNFQCSSIGNTARFIDTLPEGSIISAVGFIEFNKKFTNTIIDKVSLISKGSETNVKPKNKATKKAVKKSDKSKEHLP